MGINWYDTLDVKLKSAAALGVVKHEAIKFKYCKIFSLNVREFPVKRNKLLIDENEFNINGSRPKTIIMINAFNKTMDISLEYLPGIFWWDKKGKRIPEVTKDPVAPMKQ